MKERTLFVLSGVLLFLFLSAATGIAQTITTSISTDSLRAGDTVTLSVTLETEQQYDEIIFPDSSYFSQDFELRSRQRYRVSEFKDSLAYQLQFWGISDAKISSMPVKLIAGTDTITVFTRPITVGFQSVLNTKKPDLRPLKPIFEFARAWWFYILIVLALIAIAFIARYYYKKWQKKPEPKPPREFKPQPFLNPLRELENNIRQLKTVTKNSNINFKQFYIDLGDAIRLYFEQMYGMPALESTSREVLAELNNRAVDDTIIKVTRAVLTEADMVKFAKFQPTIEQARKALNKVEDFLSTVKRQHTNRVQMMRKQHRTQIEQERQAFNEAQKQEETV